MPDISKTASINPLWEYKHIAPLVTDEMRQAAIDYWNKMNPKSAFVPIGEINGIIYAALGASKVIQAIIEQVNNVRIANENRETF